MIAKKEIAVIVPISERYDNVREVYHAYKAGLAEYVDAAEFVYVLDGEFADARVALQELQTEGEPIRIVQLAKWFGEATALSTGFDNSEGEVILTLPAYHQVEASKIHRVLDELTDHDMVVVRRWPRGDSLLNRFQTGIFRYLARSVTGSSFQDLGCGVRAFRRQVANEVPLYGDQHRFLPILAAQRGFRLKQIDLAQSQHESHVRIYRPGIYIRRALDLFTVFFLVKFTKKPLRFFGLVGSTVFGLGVLFLLYLVADRIFFDVPLADRPALLLSSLLVVLGAQLFALGLIGELIIFAHAKDFKEYNIDKIVNYNDTKSTNDA